MSTPRPSVCVVLAVTSNTAFLELKAIPNLIRAYDLLEGFFPSHSILVATTDENVDTARVLLNKHGARYEPLVCLPCQPNSFAQALEPFWKDFDSVLIHDASRPLVDREQCERVLATFCENVDAVRPAMTFTETLKILSADSVIRETLDRSTVLRISTPELIRVSAIDIDGSDCGWFLPFKKGANVTHAQGSPEGIRINTLDEQDLMQLY